MKKSGNGSQFAYGIDGQSYTNIGEPFQVHEAGGLALMWAFLQFPHREIGLKVCDLSTRLQVVEGYADFDWFRIE